MKWAYLGNFSAPHSTENEIRRACQDGLGWEMDCYQEGDDWSIPVIVSRLSEYDAVLWTRTKGLADKVGDCEQWRLLAMAERFGAVTVGAHLDRFWGLAREGEVFASPFFRCRTLRTADGGHDAEWESAGIDHSWFPPAVSEWECQPGTPRDDLRSVVAFVGSWDGYGHAEAWHRPALVAWLKEHHGPRVKFWPESGQSAIRGKTLRDLYASVDIVVGDSCVLSAAEASERGRYASDRVPETIGRGAFLVHPRAKGITDGEYLTEGEHLACWEMGDWDELGATLDHYLSHPDEARDIAASGKAEVVSRHTYTARMAQLRSDLGP